MRAICALIVVLLVLSVVSCKSQALDLPAVSRDEMPTKVLEFADGFVPDGKSLDDIDLVWHVSTPKDGRYLVACTFATIIDDKKEPTLWVASFPVDSSGDTMDFDGHSIDTEFNRNADCQGDFSGGLVYLPDGTSRIKLSAGGYCSSPDLVKVVGTTTKGKTAETTPTNGFWFMFINEVGPAEEWAEVKGLDGDGKVVKDLSPGVLQGSDHVIK